jgi:APA family basic amino acid/polyamine antiporter
MGRDGLLPDSAGRCDRRGTPTVGLYATTLAVILMIVSGTFDQLALWSASLAVLSYVSGYLAVVVLRKRHPTWARPVPAWGYPWTTAFAIAVSVFFLAGTVAEDPTRALYVAAFVAVGYVIYRIRGKQGNSASHTESDPPF